MTIKEDWIKTVLKSISSMSRTVKGISDISSSAEKPKLEKEGDALKNRTSQNLKLTLEYLWENQERTFNSPAEMWEFIDTVATMISDGLLQEGQSLWRTWETKFRQTKPQKIEAEYKKFCQWLFEVIDVGDAIETAALIEKRLDGEVHPFADGCGRTAKVMATFVLLRRGLAPVVYRTRSEYYEKINKSDPKWITYYWSLFK